MQTNSIIIADAQHLTRLGLRRLLETKAPQFSAIVEVGNEEELTRQLQQNAPALIILDYNAPGYFSRQTIDVIKALVPEVRILVISEDHDKSSIYEVLEHGVSSFLTKTCDAEEVIDAVNATVRGQKFFCTKVLDYLLEKTFPKAESCAPAPLTPREIEIVKLVAQGLIAKEIADILNLSPHTVYTHRKKIMKKLNLNTSSELVLYAVNSGIVEKV